MAQETYDAIVVGSGVSGGWAAKELTERGLKVLMLDRGRMVRHGEDYVTEHKAPYEFKFRGLGDKRNSQSDYPNNALANREDTKHFFADTKLHPYTTPKDRPFA